MFIGKISERGAGLFEGCPEENDEKSNHVNNCNALFFYFSERTIGDNISRNDNTKRENKRSDQIEFESKMKKADLPAVRDEKGSVGLDDADDSNGRLLVV